jgi:hypothetical protein
MDGASVMRRNARGLINKCCTTRSHDPSRTTYFPNSHRSKHASTHNEKKDPVDSLRVLISIAIGGHACFGSTRDTPPFCLCDRITLMTTWHYWWGPGTNSWISRLVWARGDARWAEPLEFGVHHPWAVLVEVAACDSNSQGSRLGRPVDDVQVHQSTKCTCFCHSTWLGLSRSLDDLEIRFSRLKSVESQATRCDVIQKWSCDSNMETPRNTHMVLMRTPVRISRV